MADEPAGGPALSPNPRWRYWVAISVVTAGFLLSGLVIAGFWHSGGPGSPSLQAGPRVTASGRSLQVAVTAVGSLPTGALARSAATGIPSSLPPASTPTAVADIGASGSLLVIPGLHVRAPLVPTGAVGAPESASLDIPSDIRTVGWWDGVVHDGNGIVHEDAPAPGQPGVAVIAGHVDSAAAGPGALFHLADLKIGDVVEIFDSAGHQSTWLVARAPQTNLKSQLPSQLWVTSGPPQLALVTCGGPFDPSTGHYLDNVIVWARQLA